MPAKWKARLSNGEVIEETPGDPSSWRRLRDKCLSEGLRVCCVSNGGHDYEVREGQSVAVFFEQLASVNRGDLETKKAVAVVFVSPEGREKVRVNWHRHDDEGTKMVSEVSDLRAYDIVKEMAVPAWNAGSTRPI